jgi:hypothetical protein
MKARAIPLLALLFAPAALWAHVISMSTGYATVRGSTVEYIFRIPDYEMAHVKHPASLFDHIRFSSQGEDAVRTGQECHPDPANGVYLCASDYRFSRPVQTLDVECTFYEVTVPNHVHMLHAERAGKYDQAILDSSFPAATLAFRPPTATEIAVEQTSAGFAQMFASSVQLLLLFAVALASANRRQFASAAVAFVAGQCATALVVLHSGWQPQPRFAESAAALALAYLALEMLVFPASRGRWLMAAILGVFSGMYFNVFISESGYSAAWVLTGAALASAGCATLMWLVIGLASRIPMRDSLRVIAARGAAMVLLCTGAVWFAVRLRS